MKILLILVGGTICTTLNERGTLTVSESAGALLKSNFENSDSEYAGKIEIVTTENLGILSENMTIEKWNLMVDIYKRYTESEKFDGIIFAHGTDTLAYSAALFAQLLAGTDTPTFFVSSNARLTSPASNGDANFRYAIECICKGIRPNVYVTYKNISDGQMYLHLASRINQCANYSEDFHSAGAYNISHLTDAKIAEINARLNSKADVAPICDCTLKNNVLLIFPYVGLNYDKIDFEGFEAILHGTYHSGTACTEDSSPYSILNLITKCQKIPTDIYISPSKNEGERYDTIRIMGDHEKEGNPITFLYGTTTETAYAKLLIAYSLFTKKEDIENFLKTNRNNEYITE